MLISEYVLFPKNMVVKEVMKRYVITVEKSEPIVNALRLMVKHDIGAVIVTEDGTPVGIVTERDFTKRVCTESVGISKKMLRVCDVMSSPLITIGLNASLFDAFQKMNDNKIRRLPVEENGNIVGIFTQKDLLKKIMETFPTLTQYFQV